METTVPYLDAADLDQALEDTKPQTRHPFGHVSDRWFVGGLILIVLGLGLGGLLWKLDQPVLAGIVGASLFLTGAMMSPLATLCTMYFVVPLEGVILPVEGFTLTKALGIMLAMSFLLRVFMGQSGPVFKATSIKLYLVWMITYICLMPFAVAPFEAAFLVTQSTVLIFGLALLTGGVIRCIQDMRMVAFAIMLGGALLGGYTAVFGIGNLAHEGAGSLDQERLSGGTNANVVGHALGLAVVLSALVWARAGKKTKVFIVLLALANMVGINETASRGTMLGILMAAMIAPLFAPGMRPRTRAIALAIAILVGVCAFAILFTSMFANTDSALLQRFQMLREPGSHGATGRDVIWPVWIGYFQESPLFGKGPGIRYWGPGGSPHNDFLCVLGMGGLFSFLPYLAYMGSVLVEAIRVRVTWVRLAMFAVLVYLLVTGLVTQTHLYKSYAVGVGMVIALANIRAAGWPLANVREEEEEIYVSQ